MFVLGVQALSGTSGGFVDPFDLSMLVIVIVDMLALPSPTGPFISNHLLWVSVCLIVVVAASV